MQRLVDRLTSHWEICKSDVTSENYVIQLTNEEKVDKEKELLIHLYYFISY